jgi:hypothetical protein
MRNRSPMSARWLTSTRWTTNVLWLRRRCSTWARYPSQRREAPSCGEWKKSSRGFVAVGAE